MQGNKRILLILSLPGSKAQLGQDIGYGGVKDQEQRLGVTLSFSPDLLCDSVSRVIPALRLVGSCCHEFGLMFPLFSLDFFCHIKGHSIILVFFCFFRKCKKAIRE